MLVTDLSLQSNHNMDAIKEKNELCEIVLQITAQYTVLHVAFWWGFSERCFIGVHFISNSTSSLDHRHCL